MLSLSILIYLISINAKPVLPDIAPLVTEKKFCCNSCTPGGSGKVTCTGCKDATNSSCSGTTLETGSSVYTEKGGTVTVY